MSLFSRKPPYATRLAEINQLTVDIKTLQASRTAAMNTNNFNEVDIIQRNIISANQVLAHLLDGLMPIKEARLNKEGK